tara:strand:- start:46 stop:435 length:390 start_codon:yes stop_codon:yes gene_type:complete
MTDALQNFFDSTTFMPHGYCYLWQPDLIWLHVISDLGIGLAYLLISFSILYILHKNRIKTVPFRWVFYMFATFIIFCGITHLSSILVLWWPMYYMQGILKVMTAAVSIATAVMMLPIIPIITNMIHTKK